MKPFNRTSKFLSLLAVSLIMWSGCTEEVFTPVEVPTPVIPDFEELPQSRDPYRRIFDIYRNGDNLILQGDRFISHLTPNDFVSNYPTGVTTLNRMTNSSSLVVWSRGNGMHVQLVDQPNAGQFSYFLRMEDFDPEVRIANEVLSFRSKAIISQDNRLLVPYYRSNDQDQQLRFLLADFSLRDNDPLLPSIQLGEVQQIHFDFTGSRYNINGHEMLPVEDGFLFTNDLLSSSSPSAYKLNLDGSFQQVLEARVIQFFTYQDEVFAQRLNLRVTETGLRDVTEILSANAGGTDWQLRWTLPNEASGTLRFMPIGEDLFVYNSTSRVMFVATTINDESISFEAVDLSELRDYLVTDIEEYRGDIYIATQSGYFRRDYETFINSREE